MRATQLDRGRGGKAGKGEQVSSREGVQVDYMLNPHLQAPSRPAARVAAIFTFHKRGSLL